MSEDRDNREHAYLEAQRRRSNVYAFRKVKWGEPRGLGGSGRMIGNAAGRRFSGVLTLAIFGGLGLLAMLLLLR